MPQMKKLLLAWLGLIALTLMSVWLGRTWAGASALQLLVAGILWVKAWLVAHYFIESSHAHPLIARVLSIFILIVPLALVLTVFFGRQFATWATL